MYQKVSTDMNFVDREKEIEKFWKEEDIFNKSIENRKQGETYTFYDVRVTQPFENLILITKDDMTLIRLSSPESANSEFFSSGVVDSINLNAIGVCFPLTRL